MFNIHGFGTHKQYDKIDAKKIRANTRMHWFEFMN
jgi:hypothetical protein